MSEVSLEMNYTADEPAFIELIGLMMMDRYVGDPLFSTSHPPTKDDILDFIGLARDDIAKSKGISWMAIRYKGKLAGCSVPRPVIGVKAQQSKVSETAGYWKIGSFFIHPDFQGKGIGTKAALAFKKIHPKLVYMYEEGNHASRAIAQNLNLPFSHYLYLKGDSVYFRINHTWKAEDYIRFFVHKN